MLLVAGVRVDQIPFGQRSLVPSDLTPIHIAVVCDTKAQTVLAELQKAALRTPSIRCITTDQGADVVKAVRLFQQQNKGIAHISDMAHLGANLLKNRWTANPR